MVYYEDSDEPDVDINLDEFDRNTAPLSSINKLLICNEHGYVELDGPWDYTADGWNWSVEFPLNPDKYNTLEKTKRRLLADTEGQLTIAFADGSVEAYGAVLSVHEPDDEDVLVLAAQTPGKPDE